jgi:hypothetical protein
VKNGNFNYVGLTFAYGLLNRLTIETELGYFINKTQNYNIQPAFSYSGYGFNNSVITFKYNLITKTEKPFEWTIGAGAKIPMSTQYQMANNVELPIDVQPSTHSFGTITQSFLYKGFPKQRMKLFLTNRFETNSPDHKNYKIGNSLASSFFVTKQIRQSDFAVIFQLRHEFRGKDLYNVKNSGYLGLIATGSYVSSTGGHLIFFAPQINYTIAQKWNLSLLADIPTFRYYNGTQLGNKISFALYFSRDFGGKCEVNQQDKNRDKEASR